MSDLIDTQWNVNTFSPDGERHMVLDLIDTQWNVNIVRVGNYTYGARFNRYIVECKFSHANNSSLICSGFNRYIVECKLTVLTLCSFVTKRFNRYIVECKYIYFLFHLLSPFDLIDTQWNVNAYVRNTVKTLYTI